MPRAKDPSGLLVVRSIAALGLIWGALNTYSLLGLVNHLSVGSSVSSAWQMLGIPLLFAFLTFLGSLWLLWLNRGAAVLLAATYWGFTLYALLLRSGWQFPTGIAIVAALLTLMTVLKWKHLRPWL
jgi:hypothetical protein